jgi:predicted nucleotidyltransferase
VCAARLQIAFARARNRPDSDVAILPLDPLLPLSDELALQAQLSSVAQREVDLVRGKGSIPSTVSISVPISVMLSIM